MFSVVTETGNRRRRREVKGKEEEEKDSLSLFKSFLRVTLEAGKEKKNLAQLEKSTCIKRRFFRGEGILSLTEGELGERGRLRHCN